MSRKEIRGTDTGKCAETATGSSGTRMFSASIADGKSTGGRREKIYSGFADPGRGDLRGLRGG